MFRRSRRLLLLGAIVVLVAAGCSSSNGKAASGTVGQSPGGAGGARLTASAPGITPATITIGLENDSTGLAASTFGDGPEGAAARVAMQNAMGGVDGRQLKLVVEDTQSTPAGAQTAANLLIQQKKVFAIASDSALFFAAAPILTKANVPVTGSAFDGPEWTSSANMISYVLPGIGTYNGKSYAYNNLPKLFEMLGAKKVAVLSFSTPSATSSSKELATMLQQSGIQNCYLNTSVPIGAVDFTADVLQIKQAGCDGVVGAFTASSNVALAQAIQNAGLTGIKQYYYTSDAEQTLDNPGAKAVLNGTYSMGFLASGTTALARADQNFLAELKKWDPSYKGGIPDSGVSGRWESIDLLIEGLTRAGPNPTRQSFEHLLRADTSYTAGGLLPSPADLNYLTGDYPPQECTSFVVLQNGQFEAYPAGGAPICGQKVTFNA
jgi:branched-chain amino acid transport system substrate-binding protein